MVSAGLVLLSWCAAGVTPAWAAPVPSAQLDFGGMMRTYRLHLPAGGPPSGLVVNLHAAGATGADQAALTHYDAVADAHGFAVVYPDGIDYSWADGRGASMPDRQGVDDVGFISALVDRIVAENGIPRGRVYATGLSAGGFMANRLACERADLFAAIAPVSGTLGTNVGCNPSRPVSVLATYGTADPVVPFDGGPMIGRGGPSTVVSALALVERWRQIDGCPNAPSDEVLSAAGDGTQTHRIASDRCAAGTAVVFMRVDGGGHTWPGAPGILPVQTVGAPSRAFDASDASAQFFASHGR
ncbi:extracellular catalytic domain type 1 short-chain-length polyhydroxyalkanoate depolymerase [Mycolicibacterium frederiksbergense]|uniref:extracellular catalytic domain type 1 short-chain-length polyhydroxyalkanoate depolymerase n=1 Tax=Mycolicibacterium frederiksbergense TaxID=117567 RepID=UPI0035567727